MKRVVDIVKSVRYWAVLVLMMIGTGTVSGVDVNSESALKTAISSGEAYIRLTGDITLTSTLTITSGTIVLDLNEKTILYNRVNTSETATAMLINGTSADVIIKNGIIETRAAKGGEGSAFSKAPSGYSAVCLQFKAGKLSVWNQILIAKPGEGGDAGFLGSKGDPGKAYTIDPDAGTVGDLVAQGAYIDGASAQDYESTGYPDISTTLLTTEVKLVKYTVSYNTQEGSPQPSQSSYTIATQNFQLPTVTKNGYTLTNWLCDGTPVDINNLPTTTKREATDNVTFTANWTPTPYKVIYDTNGGNSLSNGSYNIETDLNSLPIPVKEGFEFDGWYKGDQLVTSLPKGAGDVTLKAHWLEKYKITYNLNGGNVAGQLKTEYTKKTETFVLPTPLKDGYFFEGWFDGDNKEKTTIVKGSTGSFSLTARWEIIQYKLSFFTNSSVSIPEVPYTKIDLPDLPDLTGQKPGYDFKGWFDNEACSGAAITASTVPFPQDNTKPTALYAKWTAQIHTITFNTNGGSSVRAIEYAFDKETVLPVKTAKNGYTLAGWYENESFSGDPIRVIKAFSKFGDFIVYAKWIPVEYTISYDLYYGSFPAGTVKPEKYTIESEDVALPTPIRNAFTFAGWYDNDLLAGATQAQIAKGSIGNKTFYARWTAGSVVSFEKPGNGIITVKNGTAEIKNGDKIGGGVKLSITAVPDANYRLSKLTVGGKTYTVSTLDTVMPASGGLTISAVFADPRPGVNAPKITLNPAIDFIPSGESVTVSLQNMDNASTLYYSVGGAAEKAYTAPFPVSTITATEAKVQIKAIARKNGCRDGVSTQELIFRKGKFTISFNLPKGITAINPEGGEVVSAVASGGTFEFKLEVDKNYFESLDTLEVEANNKTIRPDEFGIYTLSNTKENVTVKVSGISGIKHKITLSQTANGHIYFTDDEFAGPSMSVNHGDRVSVSAVADENYKFFAWSDNDLTNPRQILAEKDVTIQARFMQDDPGYLMVLPTLPGAKVKPLTGYPTSVKKGGTFKFYISLESDYNESIPEVYANGEKLTVYKDVYSIYNVKENVVISVNGIQLNKTQLNLADNVVAFNMETAERITDQALTSTTMVYLLAKSPQDKRFSMWNDGKGDNPRIIAVKDAQQLLPLFVAPSSEKTLKVDLPLVPGAGIGAVNANAEAIASGSDVQLKLVVLPQYSKSQPIVKVEGKVLEPETSLRASSGTKTLFYNLNKLATDVKVELSGLELNDYMATLEQTTGGSIRASKSGSLKHGTVITLDATPSAGNLFLQWNDGNTMNPYTYTITGDCVFSARFGNASIPLDNESIGMDGVRYYVADGILYIEMDRAASVHIWTFGGLSVYKATLPEGNSTIFDLQRGEYVMKVGDGKPMKVVIR